MAYFAQTPPRAGRCGQAVAERPGYRRVVGVAAEAWTPQPLEKACASDKLTPQPLEKAASSGPLFTPDMCLPVKAAGGFWQGAPDDCAQRILQPEIFDPRPSTPEHEKRFRRAGRGGADNSWVSAKKLSEKLQDELHQQEQQPRPVPNWSGHGKPSSRSMSVGALLQAPVQWESLQERKEAIYESHKREPLGRVPKLGRTLPAHMNEPGFRFGRETKAHHHHSSQNGRDVIAPESWQVQVESPETHEQYVRSHYAFAPGERVERRYEWPSHVSEDPMFRFGHAATREGVQETYPSVGNALFGGAWDDEGPSEVPLTRVVMKNGEDYRQTVNDPLGKARPGIHGPPPVPADFSFGKSSQSSGAGAIEAIRGEYTPQEQLPDHDLGKCTKEGRTNVPPEFHRDLAFGRASGLPRALQRTASVGAVPRLAIHPPSRRPSGNDWRHEAAMAARCDVRCGGGGGAASEMQEEVPANCEPNHAVYDGGAAPVMSPDCFPGADARSDFAKARDQNEVRRVLANIGCKMAPAEFVEVWEAAVRAMPKPGEAACGCEHGSWKASLEAVAKAYAERRAANIGRGVATPARRGTRL